MHVFVTGASGLVGSSVVPALVQAGHTVSAITRSEASAEKIKANGATEVHIGSMDDTHLLQQAASKADAIIHLAFDHDIAFKPGGAIGACESDRAAIRTMADALVSNSSSSSSSKKFFIGTSGLLGVMGEDEKAPEFENPNLPRYLADYLVKSYSDNGSLHTHIVRLPPVVHGPGYEHPFVATQIKVAKDTGVVGILEQGDKLWPSVHVKDAAAVYVLALEGKAPTGSPLHPVQEEGIPTKEIAEFIAKKLKMETKTIPQEEAMQRWGFIGFVLGLGGRRTGTYTREWLGWEPKEYGLFKEMENYTY
ncbi:hypothetical protein BT93_L1203 [Corymbia citriodora subsp. variegata]|uniref:NAD-dependent epimerase/dehydratase domain-containing protein n=1 Tax=Corymbia citriodora subsp. variegata TaxID=360336 RepID=A0A8T0CEF9_CORYI|nr:hypothetical protein BT93_L1203 [Corymbia citriodora subsp. variegata]